MRLWMDPEKLTAYNLSPLDVRAAIARENIELPSGRIEGEAIELPVKTLSRLNTPAEFNALDRQAHRRQRGALPRHRLRGARRGERARRAQDGRHADRGPVFQAAAGRQPDRDRRRVARAARADPQGRSPTTSRSNVAFDNTEYVRRSLLEVTETIFIAFVLVVLVVFAFLREWRTTLIPVIAIPVSIIGTFAIIHAAGFSINTLTLLGIVLAIGLVVDDAIVVLENIYAKIEAGAAPLEASIAGTKEIFFAVVSTTLTLAVVFLPLLFMGGLSGRLFREFGVTIAGAVLISALVALTLTPMLSSRLLQAQPWPRLAVPEDRTVLRGAGARLRTRAREASCGERWLPLARAGGHRRHSSSCSSPCCRASSRRWKTAAGVWVRATGPEGVGYEYMQTHTGRAGARDRRAGSRGAFHDDAGARHGRRPRRAGRR